MLSFFFIIESGWLANSSFSALIVKVFSALFVTDY